VGVVAGDVEGGPLVGTLPVDAEARVAGEEVLNCEGVA